MTGTEALSRLEEIGARVLLLPGDALDVTYPPEAEGLVAELAAHKPEAVAVLRARTPAHPCVSCGQEVDEEDLYCGGCWESRLARMPLDVQERRRRLDRARRERRAERPATLTGVTRTATGPARSIPSPTRPDGSAS